eukprot:6181532-Pleurochrysis_carterae.AAC.3
MTGPRKSQTHPRAAGTKQAWPLTNGCGRTRVSGATRIVVRSLRSVSSHACRSLKHWGVRSSRGVGVKGLRVARHKLQLRRWERLCTGRLNERSEGVQRKVSADDERSGADESRSASSRIRSSRSHALTRSTQERRCAFARSHRRSASAMESSGARARGKAGIKSGRSVRAPTVQRGASSEKARSCTPGLI